MEYVCTHCEYRTTHKNHFTNHSYKHTEKRPFACDCCTQTFKNEQGLKKHKARKSLQREQECDICGKMFKTAKDVEKHKVYHFDEKPCKCDFPDCDKSYKIVADLSRHKRVHTNLFPFPCIECDKKFKSRQEYDVHMVYSHYDDNYRSFECDVCKKKFKTKGDVSKHHRTHRQAQYKCEICGVLRRHPESLRGHMRIHNGEKPFECKQCLREFRFSSNLSSHMRVHDKKKPFRCSICQKTFSTISNSRTHEGFHRNIRNFPCSHCPRRFKTNCARKEHIRIHEGLKPYKCSYCGRLFRQSFNLKKHLLIHTQQKPFPCLIPECDYRARGACRLRDHYERMHSNDKYTKRYRIKERIFFRELRRVCGIHFDIEKHRDVPIKVSEHARGYRFLDGLHVEVEKKLLIWFELDEKQHEGYQPKKECERVELIRNALSKLYPAFKQILIRFNPDSYQVDGLPTITQYEHRLRKFAEVYHRCQLSSDKEFAVIFMYYDCFRYENSQLRLELERNADFTLKDMVFEKII